MHCLASLIYSGDEHCVICNEYIGECEALCKQCRKKMRPCTESFYICHNEEKYLVWSVFYYSNIVKELIIRLKYKSDFICGEILAQCMLELVKNNELQFDVIAYVPMSKKAQKKRGYNQSEFLANYLSRFLNIPVICNLIKTMDTKDQIGLSGQERWENMKKCFDAKENKILKNKKILIVDDVITTGATAFYCASILKKSEVKNVCILTIAKSKV